MFLDPKEVLQHLPLRADHKVGDFGAGQGTYAFALAERLPDGSVYAFEALPGHVEAIARRQPGNIFALMADLNKHIPVRDGLLNAGIVTNTLHALQERQRFVAELARVLTPRAPVLVVDWAASFNDMGPHQDAVVSPGDAVRLFQSGGFSVGAMLPAGSHHYAFIATKA
jgi:trans-aconitate methyltransferase